MAKLNIIVLPLMPGLLAVSIGGYSSAALAQGQPNIQQVEQVEEKREKISRLTSGGPIVSVDRAVGLGFGEIVPSAQLTDIDGIATAEFAIDASFAGTPNLVEKRGISYIDGSFTNASIKLKLPLNKNKNDDPVDFKKFGNKAELALSINHYAPHIPSGVDRSAFIVRFARTCIVETADEWAAKTVPPLTTEQRNQIALLLSSFDRSVSVEGVPWDDAIVEAAGKKEIKEFGAVAKKACWTTDANTLERNYARKALSQQEYRDWSRGFRTSSRTIFWGGQAAIGYNIHDVLDRANFTLRQAKRVGFDAEVFVGAVLNGGDSSIRLGGGYVRSFETQKKVEICSPPNPAGQTTCISGQDGLPTKKDTGYAALGFRQILLRNSDGEPTFALAPSATYILEDKDFEFRLPLYLQRSKKGGLDAGIQALYRTGTDDFAVGAFIGIPFDLFAR